MTPRRPSTPLGVSDSPVVHDHTPLIVDHVFSRKGEQEYALELLPAGIVFHVSRLRRAHQETVGELTVTVNGSFPNAQSVGGILSRSNFNFSSISTRSTLAKLLSERSRVSNLDWHGFLEEFAIQVLDSERRGAPSIILADEPDIDESHDTWEVDGFPVLQDLPMVLFGKGGSGKSYFAMWIAGGIAKQGIPVLYADWEFSRRQHRRRLGRLFQPMPRNLHYITCDKPMLEEAERILDLIKDKRIQYIVCDSIVFALGGKAQDDDQAGIYYRTLRRFNIGSLNIAHTTKAEDESEKQVFGSVFFQNGARSIWFIQKADENPPATIQFGLYHRKANGGELLRPRAYKLVFTRETTRVEKTAVDSVDELVAKLPILDRMKRQLQRGALTSKQLAEELGVTMNVVRAMVSRHKSVFLKVGNKIGLITNDTTTPVEEF
jgi:hypothetical protein